MCSCVEPVGRPTGGGLPDSPNGRAGTEPAGHRTFDVEWTDCAGAPDDSVVHDRAAAENPLASL